MSTDPQPEPAPKPLLKSRTIAVNIVIILGSFIPSVGEWIKANPDDTLIMLGAVNIILRLVTKERVVLWSKTAVGLLAFAVLAAVTLPGCRHDPTEVRALQTLEPLPVPGYETLHRDVPWYERVGPDWEKCPDADPSPLLAPSAPSVLSPEEHALKTLTPLPL